MTISLASIVSILCQRCGLTEDDFDVQDLEDIGVEGYKIDRLTDARSAIAVLRQIGFFDAVESGGLIRFVKRGGEPARTLQSADLGAHEYGSDPPASVTTRTTQDVELPRQLFVQYRDPARDYEDGQQASPVRLITDAVNDTYVDVAVCVSATQALQAAEILWADMWAGRWQHTLQLDGAHSELEPTDVVLVPVDGRLERMRIVSCEDSAIVIRKLALVRDDDGSYVSEAIGDPPARPPPRFIIYAPTLLVLLDLPPLRAEDTDAGIYAAMRPSTAGTWAGATIYRAPAGEPVAALATSTSAAVIGTLAEPLPAAGFTTWDEGHAVVVDLPFGQFESRPEDEVLGGANTLAIGVNGRWEVLQFVEAEQTGPTEWTLTRLLRGRRGTDHNIGRALVGDTVVLISGAGILRLPLAQAQVGVSYTYRAATIGTQVATGVDQDYTGTGESLAPFSPVHITATDMLGDIVIEWTRRDRLAIDYVPGEPVPMSEASERYEVDILTDASPHTVLRTLSSTTPTVTYTLAQQLDDFGSPVPGAITVRVYQLGALGRGHYREAIV